MLDPKNSRKHKPADIEATADSPFQFQQQTPIVLTPDLMVVKGNGTVLAARLLATKQSAARARAESGDKPYPEDERLLSQDWSKLWYVATDLEGDELKAYSIADNKTGMLAPFDMKNIGDAMRGFRDIGRLKDFGIGWNAAEMRSLLGPEKKDDPGAKLDVAAELLEKWRVSPGELFLIKGRHGVHRLLCGDCSESDAMTRLMDGVSADLLVTDPPYNVNYTGTSLGDRAEIENDNLGEDFGVWLHSVLTVASMHLGKGRSWYVWYADGKMSLPVFQSLDNAGMQVRQVLIWKKNVAVMGRQDYHWEHEPCVYGWSESWLDDPVTVPGLVTPQLLQIRPPHPDGYFEAHEPCAYGWKAGAAHRWFADRKQKTVLEFDRPSRSEAHPTMKPVPLISYLIQNSSKIGEVVLDVFLGSGTTMYASEMSQRVCYGTELEPKYCACILERMTDAGCQVERIS